MFFPQSYSKYVPRTLSISLLCPTWQPFVQLIVITISPFLVQDQVNLQSYRFVEDSAQCIIFYNAGISQLNFPYLVASCPQYFDLQERAGRCHRTVSPRLDSTYSWDITTTFMEQIESKVFHLVNLVEANVYWGDLPHQGYYRRPDYTLGEKRQCQIWILVAVRRKDYLSATFISHKSPPSEEKDPAYEAGSRTE